MQRSHTNYKAAAAMVDRLGSLAAEYPALVAAVLNLAATVDDPPPDESLSALWRQYRGAISDLQEVASVDDDALSELRDELGGLSPEVRDTKDPI